MCGNFQNIEWVDGQYQYSDISDLVVARWMVKYNITNISDQFRRGEQSGPLKIFEL